MFLTFDFSLSPFHLFVSDLSNFPLFFFYAYFVSASQVPLTLSMGEVSWVVGSDDASKIALSALAKTLRGEIPSSAFGKSKLPKEDSKSQSGPKTADRKVVLVRRVATAGSSAKVSDNLRD